MEMALKIINAIKKTHSANTETARHNIVIPIANILFDSHGAFLHIDFLNQMNSPVIRAKERTIPNTH